MSVPPATMPWASDWTSRTNPPRVFLAAAIGFSKETHHHRPSLRDRNPEADDTLQRKAIEQSTVPIDPDQIAGRAFSWRQSVQANPRAAADRQSDTAGIGRAVCGAAEDDFRVARERLTTVRQANRLLRAKTSRFPPTASRPRDPAPDTPLLAAAPYRQRC